MANASRFNPVATAKVSRMPDSIELGAALNRLAVDAPAAKTAPITDAPVIKPMLRDKLSIPEMTPLWSGITWVITAVLFAAWNRA